MFGRLRWWLWGVAAIGLACLSLALSAPLLRVSDDPIPHAEAVMVLSGHMRRMPAAIEYYHAFHPRDMLLSGGFFLPGASWGDLMLAAAIKGGVPPDICVIEHNAHSTFTNFSYMLPIIKQRQLHDITVITSWYHTRRSRWVARYFSRQTQDVRFYVVAADPMPSFVRRLRYEVLQEIASEWGKLVWYGFRHRLYFVHA